MPPPKRVESREPVGEFVAVGEREPRLFEPQKILTQFFCSGAPGFLGTVLRTAIALAHVLAEILQHDGKSEAWSGLHPTNDAGTAAAERESAGRLAVQKIFGGSGDL